MKNLSLFNKEMLVKLKITFNSGENVYKKLRNEVLRVGILRKAHYIYILPTRQKRLVSFKFLINSLFRRLFFLFEVIRRGFHLNFSLSFFKGAPQLFLINFYIYIFIYCRLARFKFHKIILVDKIKFEILKSVRVLIRRI